GPGGTAGARGGSCRPATHADHPLKHGTLAQPLSWCSTTATSTAGSVRAVGGSAGSGLAQASSPVAPTTFVGRHGRAAGGGGGGTTGATCGCNCRPSTHASQPFENRARAHAPRHSSTRTSVQGSSHAATGCEPSGWAHAP